MMRNARESRTAPPSSRRRWRLTTTLWLVLLGLVACEGPSPENDFFGDPAVWPQASRLGDSVGWLLSSESLPAPQAAAAPFFTWSRDNVEIGLVDDVGFEATVVPRLVFEVQTAMGALVRGPNHKANVGGLVAMFDLPDPWPNVANPAPPVLDLVLYVDGQAVPDWTNTIDILGSGGVPTEFGIASNMDPLQPRSMLRLRPRWDPGTSSGIDPGWVIGGIEFVLSYPELTNGGSLSHPRAIPAGDAATALCLTGPVTLEGSTNQVRVNVLVPSGFTLLNDDCDAAGCYSGRTALVDIAFDKASGTVPIGTPVFDATDFGVSELKIVDPQGVQLNTSPDGLAYFDRFVVSNLSEGP